MAFDNLTISQFDNWNDCKKPNAVVCSNDACPGLLYLYPCERILTVRSQMQTFAHVRLPRGQTCAYEHFTFACTCFLYYNLCLCKSFKEHAPRGERNRSPTVPDGAVSPHLRVQRYAFSANWQNFLRLFSKKDASLPSIHYILYTREGIFALFAFVCQAIWCISLVNSQQFVRLRRHL